MVHMSIQSGINDTSDINDKNNETNYYQKCYKLRKK